MGKKNKNKFSRAEKRLIAESRKHDQEMTNIIGWTNALFSAVSELKTEESVKYLATKAHSLLAKEHHDRGDVTYLSIFRDPDCIGQDPGG